MPESIIEITDSRLRDWPLPQPRAEGDKEERGRVVIIGGSPEMPGPLILAATAALRAGAGKVQIVTCASIAPFVASALLEGRVFATTETAAGGIAPTAAEAIIERARKAKALLIGPGMIDDESAARLLIQLLPNLRGLPVVLDAGALAALAILEGEVASLGENVIITPNASEMASLLHCEDAEIARDPVAAAATAVERFKANVVLKGATTLVARPDGKLYRHSGSNVGLAMSGSGDALAGLMCGLLARGACPAQAAVWAVYVHARAGERLAQRMGAIGFLSRELIPEFPGLLGELEDSGR